MKFLKSWSQLYVLLFMTFLCSCNDSESDKINLQAPTISVRLVDAPGDFEAVNVEVVDVMIKMDDDSDDENGWVSLESESGILNLLDFTGGISKVLVNRFPVPVGTLSQMRLVLGDGNTIIIKNANDEDEEFDLKTPSAQQSGLKLKVDTEIEEGFTYDFILDFDVDKSIVRAGNSGNIILKPVLYLSTEVNSGIIQGHVAPSNITTLVSVLVDDNGTSETDDDFIISAQTDDSGAFALWGVPAGTYDIAVSPVEEESDYEGTTVAGVVVINGEITTITDAIVLMLKPGSISGTISGLEEGVLATVSINDTDGTSVEANASGVYIIDDVTPGDYKVSISASGYVSQEFDVTIEPNESEIVDAVLELVQ